MTSDWMSLFLAALIGFSLGWALCSIWAARAIDQTRRRMREQHDEIDKIREDQMRFFKQAKEVEELFNQTRM